MFTSGKPCENSLNASLVCKINFDGVFFMGILRTMLAIAIVVFHTHKIFGLRMTGGQVSVQTFYILSGFYMALILNEKYTGKGSYKLFMTNRLLRIYPVYWVVLALALILSLVGYYGFNQPYYLARYINYSGSLSVFSLVYFVIENLVIFGQDILLFLCIGPDGHLYFHKFPSLQPQTGFNYLLVPQAWSVSLELMFYAIAPFIVRRHWKWQLLFVVMSLGLRVCITKCFSLSHDPWTYRFFPVELAFFISGSLAYRLYKLIENRPFPNWLAYVLLGICLSFIVMYNGFVQEMEVKKWLFYGLIIVSIPFIFKVFKNNKADRAIGEFSFSLYIGHHLVVMVFHGIFFSHPKYMPYYGYSTLIASLGLSLLLNKILVQPLNRKRERRMLI